MAEFEIVRSTTIAADPARVHALIDDFREWVAWSPWEALDPNLQRTYSDPSKGVGARYSWSGNKRAGVGHMEITGSTSGRIDIALTFEKPWKATNAVDFTLTPVGDAGTEVSWRMTGEHKGLGLLFSKLFNMDKMLGKDFDKGLAALKVTAEAA